MTVRDTILKLDRLYVDGKWVAPVEGETDEVINPSTGETLAQAPVGGVQEAEAAIVAARRAFDEGPWPTMAPRERSAKLQAFHDHLLSRADELADLIVAEAGSPRRFAKTQQLLSPLKYLAFCAEYAARDLSRSQPVTVTPSAAGTKVLGASATFFEPVGVVAAITPFNFPFTVTLQKLGPAFAMGNTVVLKPSPYTPLESLVLAQAAEAADFPPGVLNVVTGGLDVATMLTTDPRVDLVSFTGSDAVGAKIQEQAAPTLKRVLLELGGKSALIVRRDADLEAASDSGVFSNTTHCGQGCVLCTRHLVHNSVKDDYVALLTKKLSAIKIGDSDDPATEMGPLIRESQRARIEHYVKAGLKDGGELALGGRRPPSLDKGYFYESTVFVGVDNRSTIAQEEIFGPVTAVIGFDSDDEAVGLANDSAFGLGGHIFSRDVGTAFELARRIRTGQVSINGGNGTTNPWDAFGGLKRSGIGRELGEQGFLEYTETKVIRFHGG